MNWLGLTYEPVATFELRPSNTTKTGGKTLVCPTPYALKMALMDRFIRVMGYEAGVTRFPLVRDLIVYASPPLAVALNRTFQKILRPGKKGKIWQETIAMREFCVHTGALKLALELPDEAPPLFADELIHMAASINYFGQRGGFFQLVEASPLAGEPTNYTDLSQPQRTFAVGFLQRMDDMEPDATFDDVSSFNKRAKGARRSYNVVFPYELAHTATSHTVWRRKEEVT
ncbi:MAG: hypothetical protein AAF125_03880 [Chloroflexota bacterium]